MSVRNLEAPADGQVAPKNKESLHSGNFEVWWSCKLIIPIEEQIANFQNIDLMPRGALWESLHQVITSEGGKLDPSMPQEILDNHNNNCPMVEGKGHHFYFHATELPQKKKKSRSK